MSDPVQDVGAHFHRTDLQVHTPRDNQWKGPSFTTDADRDAYAVDFVAACRSKSLEAVAITDHHDFTFFPHIKKAAEGEVDADGQPIPGADRLTVFPGLELTLAVPCQAILILDAGIPLDRLSSVLEALAIEPHDPTEPRLAPVTRLDHIQTLEDLYSALDTRPWLRGHYIVLPNVTDGGLGTLMRSGMQAKYKNMPCVGGYLDGTVAMKASQVAVTGGSSTVWTQRGATSASRSFRRQTPGAQISHASASTRHGQSGPSPQQRR